MPAPKHTTRVQVDWSFWLSRPFDLFGASLWYAWYDSPRAKELFGVRMNQALFLEQQPGVVRQYRTRAQANRFYRAVDRLVSLEPDVCRNLLKKAERLNKRAALILKLGKPAFTLDRALEFYIDLGLYGAALPNYVIKSWHELNIHNSSLLKAAEKLRLVSYYPVFYQKVIRPLARLQLNRLGEKDPSLLNFLTIRELQAGAIGELGSRRSESKGKMFVFHITKNSETLEWTRDNAAIISQLEHISLTRSKSSLVLKGQSAYQGHSKGRARILLDPSQRFDFKKGEILVTINSNPAFMPYIKKCSAIVADEGGLMTHAAIIARELKKPCIIGTKAGTSLIKNGQMVEVDATAGRVIIKNA